MALYSEVTAELARAPTGPKVAALFDFDGTIIAGYSAFSLLKEQARRRHIGAREMLAISKALTQFGAGKLAFDALLKISAEAMAGQLESDYWDLAEKIYEQELARRVFPEMRALIEAHQELGHTVAIVSSASPYQVMPCARALGIEHVMCSELELENGAFTGNLGERICFGAGKVQAAEELAKAQGCDLRKSYFYSDSYDDIELLERVGQPRAVNPSRRLREVAERRAWPIRRFSSRGRPSLMDYARSAAATGSVVTSVMSGLPVWALTGDRQEARNFSMSLFADTASALTGLKLVVRGEENLWALRPAVFLINHQSKADVMITARLLRRNFAGIGKAEIRKMPLVGKAMEMAGVVLIDRKNAASAIATMAPLVEKMKHEGLSVAVAPEGTRTVSKTLAPFKKGPFHLAMQAGVPMVPIVIHNALDVAPKGDFVYRPGTVEVDVLPPIDVSQWTRANMAEHIEAVRQLFQNTLDNNHGSARAS
ncbi:HAD-IB family hydrolase [Spongiibacter taiwanensis]|uniref:HAD-IB family hydrolase n=1 Tax=Spongiibacter taiwanensis TaxID=1748242 RepID=UPI0020352911|nr:HAD-IB family hydrolase [Spongiibacter taiwanensis]USA42202.1 HAD-IB family hydrolase [Spongiibacter taiwanensis]